MRKSLVTVWALALILAGVGLSGCTGKEGPMGPQGPAGTNGVYLLAQYTNTNNVNGIAADGDYTVDIPEILNRRTSTYVEVYWAPQSTPSTVPSVWSPMSDGWGSTNDRIFTVSWSAAQVGLLGMKAHDFYLIKVFSHN